MKLRVVCLILVVAALGTGAIHLVLRATSHPAPAGPVEAGDYLDEDSDR